MCCLKYEQDAYEDLIRNSPKQDSFVDTPEGRGTVVELDLLRQRVKVRMEDAPETVSVFSNSEIAVLRNGKAKKNDPPIPADLAPISGGGKRKRREPEEERIFLDPIRFRYSTETIVEEPEQPEAAPVQEEETAPAGEKSGRSRRSRRRNKAARAEEQAAPAAQEEKPAKKERPKKAKPQAEPAEAPAAGEEAPKAENKKPRRHHSFHRRKKKPAGDGGQQ
jgi:hypothetical protein